MIALAMQASRAGEGAALVAALQPRTESDCMGLEGDATSRATIGISGYPNVSLGAFGRGNLLARW
jgi:hypothetical protein